MFFCSNIKTLLSSRKDVVKGGKGIVLIGIPVCVSNLFSLKLL